MLNFKIVNLLLTLFLFQFALYVNCTENIQAIHVLDPSISEYKYYTSWNSDQWVKWLQTKYNEKNHMKLLERLNATDNEDDNNNTTTPELGSKANIIIIATKDELDIAYSSNSTPTYINSNETLSNDFYWSDNSFPVYVILRLANGSFNVFGCTEKKMFISSKIDISTYAIVKFHILFPKKVKNPKDTLKIPLSVCKKVSQVRGLLDEIRYKLFLDKENEKLKTEAEQRGEIFTDEISNITNSTELTSNTIEEDIDTEAIAKSKEQAESQLSNEITHELPIHNTITDEVLPDKDVNGTQDN